jgi:hypothetical protein
MPFIKVSDPIDPDGNFLVIDQAKVAVYRRVNGTPTLFYSMAHLQPAYGVPKPNMQIPGRWQDVPKIFVYPHEVDIFSPDAINQVQGVVLETATPTLVGDGQYMWSPSLALKVLAGEYTTMLFDKVSNSDLATNPLVLEFGPYPLFGVTSLTVHGEMRGLEPRSSGEYYNNLGLVLVQEMRVGLCSTQLGSYVWGDWETNSPAHPNLHAKNPSVVSATPKNYFKVEVRFTDTGTTYALQSMETYKEAFLHGMTYTVEATTVNADSILGMLIVERRG